MDRIPLTLAGFEKMRNEINQLKTVDRAQNIKDIEEARAHGDLSENAEYSAAKEKQSLINGRILDLEGMLSRAEVIDPKSVPNKDRVVFGATVTLYDIDSSQEVTYQIVGDYESDIKVNRIAISSPIARGILGRREGDEAKINTPKGQRVFEIVKIEYL